MVDLLKVDVERAELEVLAGVQPAHWPRIRQVTAPTQLVDLWGCRDLGVRI